MWLQGRGFDLAELAETELELRRKKGSNAKDPRTLSVLPSALMGPVRLRPGEDPLLRLDPDAIGKLYPNSTFDPDSAAVEVILEFLGAARDLPPLGVIPALHEGDLFAGWVNLNRVQLLAQHPAIVRVEVVRNLAPASDPGGNGTPGSPNMPNTTATGQGVRLAVIDLGFDFLHEALLRRVGDTEEVRALWLHDMELPPPYEAPAGALGLRLAREELQCALRWYNSQEGRLPGPIAVETHLGRLASPPATDPDYTQLLQQHGTAVAGIAAGNGRGSGSVKSGVAPQADLALIAVGTHDETRFAELHQSSRSLPGCFRGHWKLECSYRGADGQQ